MRAVSALVLLMLGALIHVSCALKCWECTSNIDGNCDDEFDSGKSGIIERTCPSSYNVCIKGKGSSSQQSGRQTPKYTCSSQ